MAKIALLGDTHFSLRNGDKRFIKYFEKLYTDWFFPELKSRGIDTIYQLGDLFDKRTGNDSYAVDESLRYFFDPVAYDGYDFVTIIGNHDAYFKNSIKVNSPEQLLSSYKKFLILDKPHTIGNNIDFIPWICDENRAEIFKFIERSQSEYCIGHFEITGFQMYKGVKGHDGLSKDLFKKYKMVFSGHYHTSSREGNILYTGSPGEYTWSDAEDPKGFYVFDSISGSIEFVENPHTMFTKLYYNEDQIHPIDPESVTDHFIRVYVLNRKDLKKYDKWIESINNLNPHEVKVIEEGVSVESEVGDDVDIRNTPDLIEAYIDGMETDLDKELLKIAMRKLYIEAQT